MSFKHITLPHPTLTGLPVLYFIITGTWDNTLHQRSFTVWQMVVWIQPYTEDWSDVQWVTGDPFNKRWQVGLCVLYTHEYLVASWQHTRHPDILCHHFSAHFSFWLLNVSTNSERKKPLYFDCDEWTQTCFAYLQSLFPQKTWQNLLYFRFVL